MSADPLSLEWLGDMVSTVEDAHGTEAALILEATVMISHALMIGQLVQMAPRSGSRGRDMHKIIEEMFNALLRRSNLDHGDQVELAKFVGAACSSLAQRVKASVESDDD